MRVIFTNREFSRNKVFPLKISKMEEEFLRKEAKNQGKSMAMLIREGKLKTVKKRKNFYEIL